MRPATMSADNLALLRAELERTDLQIYSVVVLARRDLEGGKVDAALARLRVDADKLRCYDTQINRLLASHGPAESGSTEGAIPSEGEKVMKRFINVTITADSSDTSPHVRRAAILADEIVGVVDVAADEFLNEPMTRIHLREPTDFESAADGGGVVRSTRQIFVKESFDEVSRRIADALGYTKLPYDDVGGAPSPPDVPHDDPRPDPRPGR